MSLLKRAVIAAWCHHLISLKTVARIFRILPLSDK